MDTTEKDALLEAEFETEMEAAFEDDELMQEAVDGSLRMTEATSDSCTNTDAAAMDSEIMTEVNNPLTSDAQRMTDSRDHSGSCRQKRPRPRWSPTPNEAPISSKAIDVIAPPQPQTSELQCADDEISENGNAGYMWGINFVTGRTIEEEDASQAQDLVKLSYGSYMGVQLSTSELRKIKAQECAQILRNKKLVLVLDLDHTLLHSCAQNELLDQEVQTALRNFVEQKRSEMNRGYAEAEPSAGEVAEANGSESAELADDVDGSDGDGTQKAVETEESRQAKVLRRGIHANLLHFLPDIHMWTKLRPGVHNFLHGVAELFDLYVYTMGTKAYASRMVKLLDPDGSLGLKESDRVIGREDSTVGSTKVQPSALHTRSPRLLRAFAMA